jgi:hypothetical protein
LGAPAANGAPKADGAPNGLDAAKLNDQLARLMSFDASAAREAALALIGLGAGDERLCDAIAAAANEPQLQRLISLAEGLYKKRGEEPRGLWMLQLHLLLRGLMSADAAVATNAADWLSRLGSCDRGGALNAITAAADLPQLLRLAKLTVDRDEDGEDGEEYDEAADPNYPYIFFELQDDLRGATMEELARRAARERAVCEAIIDETGALELVLSAFQSHSPAEGAAGVLRALVGVGGERCRAAVVSAGALPLLVRALTWESRESSCAAHVLGALAAAGSDAERDAILAAGAVPPLIDQMSGRAGEMRRADAVDIVLSSLSALRSLVTTTERARGRVAEVRAAGGVAALIGLLDETLICCGWWLDFSESLSAAAEAALLAMGEEHRRAGSAAAGPFLSAEDAEALRDMAAGTSRCVAVESDGSEKPGEGEEGEEGGKDGGFYEDNEQRAAAAERLLALLA